MRRLRRAPPARRRSSEEGGGRAQKEWGSARRSQKDAEGLIGPSGVIKEVISPSGVIKEVATCEKSPQKRLMAAPR